MAAEATEEEGEPVPTEQVVEFILGGERFAVAVGEVDSIVELAGTTRVPRTPEAIDGVMDLRGEITAIIDPQVYLDVDPDGAAQQRVLVLDESKDKQKLGLRVDEVIGVEEYPVDRIVDPADLEELETEGVRRRTIRSIIRRDAPDADFEPIAWLDVDEIVAQARRATRDV